jgi:hypothetical protein
MEGPIERGITATGNDDFYPGTWLGLLPYNLRLFLQRDEDLEFRGLRGSKQPKPRR